MIEKPRHSEPFPLTAPPGGTAAALIAAGLDLFGQKGFAATSTREVAQQAGTNVASIAYHFGGKEGLHAACAGEVVRRMSIVAALGEVPADLPPERAQMILEQLIRAMAQFLLADQGSGPIVAFILREVSAGTEGAIEVLYDGLFEGKHRQLCQLWAVATGQEAESHRTRLAVFAALGQLLYFRIGLPVVSRRMGWEKVGSAEAEAVAETVIFNLRASLERSRST